MNSMLVETGPPAPLTPESTQHKPRDWEAALLMASPLMQLFHGHGGHGKHDSHSPRPQQE